MFSKCGNYHHPSNHVLVVPIWAHSSPYRIKQHADSWAHIVNPKSIMSFASEAENGNNVLCGIGYICKSGKVRYSKALTELASKDISDRVSYFENGFVLCNFSAYWTNSDRCYFEQFACFLALNLKEFLNFWLTAIGIRALAFLILMIWRFCV